MEEDGGQQQADDCSGDAQQAASEGGGEFRFEDEDDGHGEPVGAAPVDGARQSIAKSDKEHEAKRMTEGGRVEIEIGAEGGESSAEAEPPGLTGFLLGEEQGAGGSVVGGKIERVADLAAEGVHLKAGIFDGRGEKCGGRAGDKLTDSASVRIEKN